MATKVQHMDQDGIVKRFDGVIEDGNLRPKTISKQGKIRQTAAAFLLSCSGIMYGMTCTYTAVAAPSWTADSDSPFNLTTSDISLHASIVNFGSLFGSLSTGTLVNLFGPKKIVLLSAFPYIAAWVMVAYPVNHLILFTGRVLSGLSIDIYCLAGVMYLNDFVCKELRGRLQSLVMLLLNMGSILTYALGMALDWKTLALFNCVLPIPFLLANLYLPESPSRLLAIKSEDAALRSLRWYRGDISEYALMEEFKEKKDDLARAKQKSDNGLRELLSPIYIRPMMIALVCVFLRQASGCYSILSFTVDIFTMTGTSINAHIGSLISASVQLVSQLLASSLADKWGRKKFSVASCFICGPALISFGVFHALKDSDKFGHRLESLGFIPLICLMGVMLGNGLGLTNLQFYVPLEVLPAKIRTQGLSITCFLNALSCFIVVNNFYAMTESVLRIQGTFWVYGSCCVLLGLIVAVFVPESKGMSLAEVERMMSKSIVSKNKTRKTLKTEPSLRTSSIPDFSTTLDVVVGLGKPSLAEDPSESKKGATAAPAS